MSLVLSETPKTGLLSTRLKYYQPLFEPNKKATTTFHDKIAALYKEMGNEIIEIYCNFDQPILNVQSRLPEPSPLTNTKYGCK